MTIQMSSYKYNTTGVDHYLMFGHCMLYRMVHKRMVYCEFQWSMLKINGWTFTKAILKCRLIFVCISVYNST